MTINCQQKNNSITIIGERIKSARKLKKLSQAELADKLELTQGFIGHLEKGRNQPTLDQITRMATILDCNMSWLATGEGKMKPDFTYQDNNGRVVVGEVKSGYSVFSELEEMLLRIINEGDKTKLAAVRGVLAVYDPGRKAK